uniref:Uncharacterized protein n=1 Tax=Parascaris univalens TaxID=6257 RepID=A0A915CDT5_PARUN
MVKRSGNHVKLYLDYHLYSNLRLSVHFIRQKHVRQYILHSLESFHTWSNSCCL